MTFEANGPSAWCMSIQTGSRCHSAAAVATSAGMVAVKSKTCKHQQGLWHRLPPEALICEASAESVDAKISLTLWLRRAESVQACCIPLAAVILAGPAQEKLACRTVLRCGVGARASAIQDKMCLQSVLTVKLREACSLQL